MVVVVGAQGVHVALVVQQALGIAAGVADRRKVFWLSTPSLKTQLQKLWIL